MSNSEFSRYNRGVEYHSPYCYPDSQVLINKANIHDQDELNAFEEEITRLRQPLKSCLLTCIE